MDVRRCGVTLQAAEVYGDAIVLSAGFSTTSAGPSSEPVGGLSFDPMSLVTSVTDCA
jgi:hypothetical protein